MHRSIEDLENTTKANCSAKENCYSKSLHKNLYLKNILAEFCQLRPNSYFAPHRAVQTVELSEIESRNPSILTFLLDLIANIPASVHTLRISAPTREELNISVKPRVLGHGCFD